MINYFILSLIKGNKEHMHVFKRCRFSVKLGLKYRIIHEIDTSHSSYDLALLTGIISLMMDTWHILDHRVIHHLHVAQG